jgi:hypothetical protein
MSLKVIIPKGFKKYCLKCNSHNLTFWQINLAVEGSDIDNRIKALEGKKNILKIKRCNKCNREVSIRT